jgi:hypothetical protein
MSIQQEPPDGMITRLTIEATLLEHGQWMIRCPQWKCEFPHWSLSTGVLAITTEVVEHNQAVLDEA